MVASSRFFFQLNDGEQLYDSSLVRILLVDRVGEFLREFEVRLARFAPDHVGVGRVGEAARDRLFETRLRAIETFDRALAGQERLVVFVDVGRDQVGGFRIGAGEQHGRHAGDIGGETRGGQLGDVFARRHEHLAAHVAAFLHRGELVFEVHARGARFDHRLHQFERVQHAAETGFCVARRSARSSRYSLRRPDSCLPTTGSGRRASACC